MSHHSGRQTLSGVFSFDLQVLAGNHRYSSLLFYWSIGQNVSHAGCLSCPKQHRCPVCCCNLKRLFPKLACHVNQAHPSSKCLSIHESHLQNTTSITSLITNHVPATARRPMSRAYATVRTAAIHCSRAALDDVQVAGMFPSLDYFEAGKHQAGVLSHARPH